MSLFILLDKVSLCLQLVYFDNGVSAPNISIVSRNFSKIVGGGEFYYKAKVILSAAKNAEFP